MKKKSKILLSITIALAICALLAFTYFLMQKTSPKPKVSSRAQSVEQETQVPVQQGAVTFPAYSVYESSDLDFRFIVAKLSIQSDSETYSLSDFVTSEGIVLSDIHDYVTQLESHNFFVGKKNVWFSFSDKNSFAGNILIPVTSSGTNQISLTCKGTKFDFDLTKNLADTNELLNTNTNTIVRDENTFQLRITNIFEITGDDMYQNDTLLTLPSSARVFAIKVDASCLNDTSFCVDHADYEANDGTKVDAEDASIHSMKYENLLGQSITEEKEAYLFFIQSSGQSILNNNGVLHLYINGSDTPVDVKVSVEGD